MCQGLPWECVSPSRRDLYEDLAVPGKREGLGLRAGPALGDRRSGDRIKRQRVALYRWKPEIGERVEPALAPPEFLGKEQTCELLSGMGSESKVE